MTSPNREQLKNVRRQGYLTVNELSSLTGYAPQSLYNLKHRGLLPFHKKTFRKGGKSYLLFKITELIEVFPDLKDKV